MGNLKAFFEASVGFGPVPSSPAKKKSGKKGGPGVGLLHLLEGLGLSVKLVHHLMHRC
jgi:hypothetical protein